MHVNYRIMSIGLFCFFELCAGTIKNKPLCSIYTPDSILYKKGNYQPLGVGDRMRYATCTGVAWFHGDYLATLNLYGEKIITYRFDEGKKEFIFLQEINNGHGAQLHRPENMTISPDGTLLAIANARVPSI